MQFTEFVGEHKGRIIMVDHECEDPEEEGC